MAPAVRLQGSDAQLVASGLSLGFKNALDLALASLDSLPGVQIVRLDVFTIVQHVVAKPADFGLTDVQDSCIELNTFVHAFCGRPDKFLFWDGIHPTVAGHAILARQANVALGITSALVTAR